MTFQVFIGQRVRQVIAVCRSQVDVANGSLLTAQIDWLGLRVGSQLAPTTFIR